MRVASSSSRVSLADQDRGMAWTTMRTGASLWPQWLKVPLRVGDPQSLTSFLLRFLWVVTHLRLLPGGIVYCGSSESIRAFWRLAVSTKDTTCE